ncbi:putative adipose-regulatory protein-domain-containing protein [Pilobolus umbonatus]|nr:putative adipose-regulatory protein-domain-containing protein [Pilobolus umbonatus]
MKDLLSPIARVVLAPAAQRTFVKTTVLFMTISSIIVTSMVVYILFYHYYVPPVMHSHPVWFQYDYGVTPKSSGPHALIDIMQGIKKSGHLRHDQHYDISVQLHVPTSDINFNIGNFMVHVQLQLENGTTVLSAKRPSILRYQSPTQRILHVFAKALPLLVGLTEESQLITTKIIEGFREHKSQPITKVAIDISNPRIQIYDAKLLILANFRGLRYYMYYHYIITCILSTLLFSIIEIIFASVAWKTFGEQAWHRLEERTDQAIHEEDISDKASITDTE